MINSEKIKVILINLLALIIVFFAVEIVCYKLNTDFKKENEEKQVKYPEGYFIGNNVDYLGYAPTKNFKAHVVKKYKDKIIYDVNYKINNDGLRETLSSNEKSDKCLLFFVCSYMFGEGVNDNETLPYYTGLMSGNKYRIYNFGFHGYGPHQMLSELEHGITEKIAKNCKESTIIYSRLPYHIQRLAGRTYWDEHGPKYVLENGKVVFKGHFDDEENILEQIEILFPKLQFYKVLKRYIVSKRYNLNQNEKEYYTKLYIEVLKKSWKLAREKHNANRFIIIFWDWNKSDEFNSTEKLNMLKTLKDNSFEYYMQSDMLPDFNNKWNTYQIEDDGHPTSKANFYLGKFLVKKLEEKH